MEVTQRIWSLTQYYFQGPILVSKNKLEYTYQLFVKRCFSSILGNFCS